MNRQNMTAKITLLIVLCVACSMNIAMGQEAKPTSKDDGSLNNLKVMSFNIRYGRAKDGANHWNNRHALVIQAIEQSAPDLLGTQETLAFQAEYLRKHLPKYSHFGRGRESDPDKGEQCAIFFRKDRFDKLKAGHFWLSPEPNKAGSRGWDAALPRMVTWVKLKDRQTENEVVWFNTHFDHRGAQARLESARLLARKVPEIAGDEYFIITGDFNASVQSKPYQALFGNSGNSTITIVDTFKQVVKNNNEPQGTFNGFKGTSSGARIDWIAASPKFSVERAGIDKFQVNGQYPSDHFPVTATLQFKK